MRLCNHCGRPMETSRYGTTHTLCEDCAQELRESYDPPEDDMQPAQELAFECAFGSLPKPFVLRRLYLLVLVSRVGRTRI